MPSSKRIVILGGGIGGLVTANELARRLPRTHRIVLVERVVAHRVAAEIAGTRTEEEFGGDGYCALEAGEGSAGFAFGDFFGEPSPEIHLKRVGKAWHAGKVLFERWWLSPFGLRRNGLSLALRLGGRASGVPVVL